MSGRFRRTIARHRGNGVAMEGLMCATRGRLTQALERGSRLREVAASKARARYGQRPLELLAARAVVREQRERPRAR